MAFARIREELRPMSDLNTTPLIDVLLVLLIMFILTIPMQPHEVDIALPTGRPTTEIRPDHVRNIIAIDAAGTIFWNGTAVSEPQLRAVLAAALRLPVEPALDLEPVAEARYETVEAVMAAIKRAGVTKLGLPGNAAFRDF